MTWHVPEDRTQAEWQDARSGPEGRPGPLGWAGRLVLLSPLVGVACLVPVYGIRSTVFIAVYLALQFWWAPLLPILIGWALIRADTRRYR